MKPKPSTLGPNGAGRDAKGRFAKGNRLGRGSPLAGQAARLRAELLATVKPADLRRLVQALLAKALNGDVPAAKVVLSYTLGEPQPWDFLERLEHLETVLHDRNSHDDQ